MPANPMELSFITDLVDEAIAEIKQSGNHRLYCNLTGYPYATIADSEISTVLNNLISRKPLITKDRLIDEYELRHAVMCSGPCPALRFQRDRNELLFILRNDRQGPAKLLAYLAGRLFFDSLVSQRERNTTANLFARLSFLRLVHQTCENLPLNWSQSLTATDELTEAAAKAINVLTIVGGTEPTQIEKSKAMQKCLEILLRIDAIHNLRYAVIDHETRTQLIAFRENEQFDPIVLARLLERLESDSIVRLMKGGSQFATGTTKGNAMIITAALESINWTATRFGRSREQFMESLEKGIAKGKLSVGVGAQHILTLKKLTENNSGPISKRKKSEIESALKVLHNDLTRVTESDKRLETLETFVKRQGIANETRGKLRVQPGTAIKHLAESYLDAGKAIPEEIKSKIRKLKKSGVNVKVESKGQLSARQKKIAANKARAEMLESALGFDKLLNDLSIPNVKNEKKD